MASWIQNKLRAAEGLLEAVDRSAKVTREQHPMQLPPAAAKLGTQVNSLWREGAGGGDGSSSNDSVPAEPSPTLPSPSLPKPQQGSPQRDITLKVMKKDPGNGKPVKTEKKKGRLSRTSSSGGKSASTPTVEDQAAFSAAQDSLDDAPAEQAVRRPEVEASPFQVVADSPRLAELPRMSEDSALGEHMPIAQTETEGSTGQLTPQDSIGDAFAWADGEADEASLAEVREETQERAGNGDTFSLEILPPPPASVDYQDRELELTQDTVTLDSNHDHGWVDDFGALELAPPTSIGEGEKPSASAQPAAEGHIVGAGKVGVHEVQGGMFPGREDTQQQPDDEGADMSEEAGGAVRGENAADGEEEEMHEAQEVGSSGDIDVAEPEEATGSAGREVDPGSMASELRGSASAAGLHYDLEEAREMAKLSTAASASREVRLQKVCDKLRVRLEELKEENIQLEELLSQADARANGGAGEAESLRAELKQLRAAHSRTESALKAKLKAKGEELDKVQIEAEKQRAEAESLKQKLDHLQQTTEELLRERQTSEGRLVTALREQLHEVEQRLDEERAAHQASRKSASARHEQLETDLSESATDISNLHRTVDERSSKIAELEAHVNMLEEEHEETMGKLRRVEDIAARERARADSNSSDALEAQVAAWKEEADKGRRAVLELEAERGELQESCAKLAKQVEELEAVVKDARGAANSDLSRRHKEVTDLLYLKQTQLEKMAAEKAAAQLSLEREVMGLREELEKSRRKASSARDPIETYGAEMTPMDTIGAYYTRLANDERLGGAVKAFAKAVDVTAANAMRLMREYPLARVIFFLYSICIHLFVYVLIQRLQNKILLTEDNLPNPAGPQI